MSLNIVVNTVFFIYVNPARLPVCLTVQLYVSTLATYTLLYIHTTHNFNVFQGLPAPQTIKPHQLSTKYFPFCFSSI